MRPADPAEPAAESERVVAQSDDFTQHREAFVKAVNQLIEDGRCTGAEIEEMGGWVKSTNERDRPIYFTYCGGMTTTNRLYLNVETGGNIALALPESYEGKEGVSLESWPLSRCFATKSGGAVSLTRTGLHMEVFCG